MRIQKALVRVLNMMHEEEWVPPSWREERVRLIHKAKTRTSLDYYRGLAMTINSGKVFTMVWADKLAEVVEDTIREDCSKLG